MGGGRTTPQQQGQQQGSPSPVRGSPVVNAATLAVRRSSPMPGATGQQGPFLQYNPSSHLRPPTAAGMSGSPRMQAAPSPAPSAGTAGEGGVQGPGPGVQQPGQMGQQPAQQVQPAATTDIASSTSPGGTGGTDQQQNPFAAQRQQRWRTCLLTRETSVPYVFLPAADAGFYVESSERSAGALLATNDGGRDARSGNDESFSCSGRTAQARPGSNKLFLGRCLADSKTMTGLCGFAIGSFLCVVFGLGSGIHLRYELG
ncbi:hypothetical protein BDQ17DRAFT_120103 [Cyathus striatus]|nr:hypothetical protein BDQ17DRAFT_120103 [Cyathus striatus]